MRVGLASGSLFILCALLPACGGSRSGAPSGAGAPTTFSSNAPDWARVGDKKTGDGSLFNCEGGGPTEELAQRAAFGTCSAKICELCGVEVKATVETKETLTKVDITRKVVETCRRVRKTEDEVRYKQSACGPGGCTSWLQVFFSAEAEARECKAYADGKFADSGECEGLIDRFRNTQGLDAASFRTRTALLDQAIIACAEIDVRPTPKLTAMDEILWQGVLSPSHTAWEKTRDDPGKPIDQRVRVYLADRETMIAREHAGNIYRPIDRQPLIESKVFVDRLALVRNAMRAYSTLMTFNEALNHMRYAPEREPDSGALVAAMRDVIPFGKFDKDRLYTWAIHELTDARRDFPAARDFLIKSYPPPWTGRLARDFAGLFAADGKVTDQEWVMATQGEPCADCLGTLVGVRDHGGDGKRLARIAEATTKVYASEGSRKRTTGVFEYLSGDWLLRAESKLSGDAAATVYTWDRLKRARDKLGTKGSDAAEDQVRKALAVRLAKQLERDIAAERCDRIDSKLDLLEAEGQSTRRFEADMCRCLQDPKDARRVGHLDGLYLRLIEWGASCVRKGGPS